MISLWREASKDGVPGDLSLRRIAATFCFLLSAPAGMFALASSDDWRVIAVAFGLPIVAGLFLLFFTTLTDIKEIVSIARWRAE
jgi:hypothetical protein